MVNFSKTNQSYISTYKRFAKITKLGVFASFEKSIEILASKHIINVISRYLNCECIEIRTLKLEMQQLIDRL